MGQRRLPPPQLANAANNSTTVKPLRSQCGRRRAARWTRTYRWYRQHPRHHHSCAAANPGAAGQILHALNPPFTMAAAPATDTDTGKGRKRRAAMLPVPPPPPPRPPALLVQVLCGNPVTAALVLQCIDTDNARTLRRLHPAMVDAVGRVPWADMSTDVRNTVQWRAALPAAVGVKVMWWEGTLDVAPLAGLTSLDMSICWGAGDAIPLLPPSLTALTVVAAVVYAVLNSSNTQSVGRRCALATLALPPRSPLATHPGMAMST